MVTVRTHPILESRKENRLQLRAEGFELLGGLLRAGQRTDCSGQALEAEGFELLRGAPFLSVARSSCWTQKGTPYGVHDAIC